MLLADEQIEGFSGLRRQLFCGIVHPIHLRIILKMLELFIGRDIAEIKFQGHISRNLNIFVKNKMFMLRMKIRGKRLLSQHYSELRIAVSVIAENARINKNNIIYRR